MQSDNTKNESRKMIKPDFLFTPSKICPLESLIMFVQGSHTFAMFYAYAHGKRGIPVLHMHTTLMTFTQFAQNSTVVCTVCLHCMALSYMHSTVHVKGKRYTRFSHRIHAGYMQIDNTFHACDYRGARRLHATCHMHVENQHPRSQQKSLFCRLNLEYC